MDRTHLESAIKRGVPFTLRMADGQDYHVRHREYISLTPKGSAAIIFDDQDHFFVLPLLTITGLVYKDPAHETDAA
jgi:hypothetical protein